MLGSGLAAKPPIIRQQPLIKKIMESRNCVSVEHYHVWNSQEYPIAPSGILILKLSINVMKKKKRQLKIDTEKVLHISFSI